jgi:hypothetical protein
VTPSRVKNVLTISFLISFVLSWDPRLELSPPQHETAQRSISHLECRGDRRFRAWSLIASPEVRP